MSASIKFNPCSGKAGYKPRNEIARLLYVQLYEALQNCLPWWLGRCHLQQTHVKACFSTPSLAIIITLPFHHSQASEYEVVRCHGFDGFPWYLMMLHTSPSLCLFLFISGDTSILVCSCLFYHWDVSMCILGTVLHIIIQMAYKYLTPPVDAFSLSWQQDLRCKCV